MKRYVRSEETLSPNLGISKVSMQELHKILDSAEREGKYRPYGYFYAYNPNGKYYNWVAIDNGTGAAWTEEFATETEAIAWLNGEFEMDDHYGRG